MVRTLYVPTYVYIFVHMLICKKRIRHFFSGSAAIMDNIATVTVDGLVCEKIYTIVAGGVDNDGNLVGPQFYQGTVTVGSCPPPCVVTKTMPTGNTHIHIY